MIPLIKEFKKSTPLIEILCGTAISVYITTGKNPVNWDGKVWFPEPAIKVELPKQSGTLSQDPCEVTLPRLNSQHPGVMTLAALLSSPRTIPTMTIRVINLIESSTEELLPVYLYEGVANASFRNAQKQQGTVKMSFLPEHLLLLEQSTLGRRADASCDFVYGGLGCFVDVQTFFEATSYWPTQDRKIRKAHVTATVFNIQSKRELTVFLDPVFHPGADQRTLTQQPKGWWVRGFFEKDGLRIGISDWKFNDTAGVGTNIFILNRIPPADWNGAQLVLHPGCQRTPQACADRNNSERFGGLGYGIPAYNPIMETDDR